MQYSETMGHNSRGRLGGVCKSSLRIKHPFSPQQMVVVLREPVGLVADMLEEAQGGGEGLLSGLRVSFLLLKSPKIGGLQDWNPLDGPQDKKVLISSDQTVHRPGRRRCEDEIVTGITTHT